jgi:hypothetical protein
MGGNGATIIPDACVHAVAQGKLNKTVSETHIEIGRVVEIWR